MSGVQNGMMKFVYILKSQRILRAIFQNIFLKCSYYNGYHRRKWALGILTSIERKIPNEAIWFHIAKGIYPTILPPVIGK